MKTAEELQTDIERACIAIEEAINNNWARMNLGYSSQANFDQLIRDLRRVVELLKSNPKHQPGLNANVKQVYPNGRFS